MLKRMDFGGKRLRKSAEQSALLALLCWLGAGLLFDDMLLGALAATACFFALLALLFYYPVMQRRKHGSRVEAGIPFVLLNIAVELNLGVSFISALQHAAEGKSVAAGEFALAALEIRQGASVQDALRHITERVDSVMVKRAVVQLVAAFENGGGKNAGEPAKRIAGEILARQRIESKLFGGKLVVFSLLFIAVSAIIPTLFQSFSIIGSAVLRWSFTPLQSIAIICVGFPLLDAAVLLYIRSKTPVFLRETG